MSETFTSVSQDEAGFRDRARLSFDLDADICVIGAGLAGLSVALEAARLGASVAVLEGRQIGWNASGNQLGTVMPGFALPLTDLIERIGFRTLVVAMLLFYLLLVERRRPLIAVPLAVAVALGTFHLINDVLRVPLPVGPWGF